MMMPPLRDKTPSRRTGRRVIKYYTGYRKTLKEDFNNRCGYCGSFDAIYKRTFAIDHFIPRKPYGCTHTLPDNDYYNLVYSCGHCNGSKSNKWPTNDVTKANDGTVGFVDPVDPIYDTFFHRKADGSIHVVDTNHRLSQNIYEELNLKNGVHAILWKLELLTVTIEKLENLHGKSVTIKVKKEIDELNAEYRKLVQSLFNR